MATTDRPSPVSRDNSGLWMKMDFDPVPDQGDLLPSGETPRGPPERTSLAPAAITRYYYMDEEGSDDVFLLPPPPPGMAPPTPAGGVSVVADASAPDPRVTNVSASVTKAEENLKGLERRHVENQLTAVESIPQDTVGTDTQTDNPPLPEELDSVPSTNQDQVSLECPGVSAIRKTETSRREDLEDTKESEDIAMVTEETCTQEDNNDKYPDETPSSVGESTGKKLDKNVLQTDKDTSGQKAAELMGEPDDVCGPASDGNGSTQVADTKNVTCGQPDLCNSNTNQTDTAEVTSDDEAHVDTRPLKYHLTKEAWVRRDSGNSEIHLPRIPTPRNSSAGLFPQTKELEGQKEGNMEEEQKCAEIATDIHQGEQLLHRLSLVQRRQDELQVTPPSPQVATETANRTAGPGEATRAVSGIEAEDFEGGDLKTNGCRFHINKVQEETTVQGPEDIGEDGRRVTEAVEKVERFPPATPTTPGHHKLEVENSDDDQSDSGVSADFSPISTQDTPSKRGLHPSAPASHHHHHHHHQTCTEPTQESLMAQSLQRARGLFNLADDPDVLEIPFQAAALPSEAERRPSSDRQASEQRMHREISQETHRELAMVNQGKIPGCYSKGEARQMKETKLLFEAFQQEDPEGPTRHRRPAFRGRIYPSVLERTRSLETLSVKGCPVSRTQSMRSHRATSERERSPERARSKSPAAGRDPRDKPRLSPYPNKEKYLRLFKSMDSLNIDPQRSNEHAKLIQRSSTQELPMLKDNPFFKLRPALALKPEVEKDIREAREREEELRRQRCTLYGENRERTAEDDSETTAVTVPDIRQQSKGKLDRIWPPPPKKDQLNSEQTQEPKLHKVGGQKTPLWKRWEAGMTNTHPPSENN